MTHEERANELLSQHVSKFKLFIDTCSLLHNKADIFIEHLIPHLKEQEKRIFVPLRCIEEIIKKQDDSDRDLSGRARRAMELIKSMKEQDLIDIRGEKTDNFADNVFLVQFTKYRMMYSLMLITQDRNLGRDILALNQSQAVKGKRVFVRRINKYGFLSMHEDEEKSRKTKKVNDDQRIIIQNDIFLQGLKVTDIPNDIINISHMPKENETVLSQTGEIRLTRKLAAGGEGTIYLTNTSCVAKIYKPEKNTVRKHEKLKLMISKKIDYQGICYPFDIIYNKDHQFVGYLMPKADGKEIQKSIFIKPLFQKYFPGWKKRDLVELCITILKKIEYLNKRNIIMGDINPLNILVVSPKDVFFVDTDSYQVGEFPCPVGTVNFTAPEIQRMPFSNFLRTQYHENFAIATLLFMLMLPGKPPYSQQGGEHPIDNIIAMDFSYPLGDNSNRKAPDGPWRFMWSHLTYDLKEAFYNTFRKGGKYALPEKRLNANGWIKIFQYYLELLDSGKYGKQDIMSEEIYPTRYKKNPKLKYIVCRMCGKEYAEQQCQNGVCPQCLKEGEVYHCKRCGKEMVYDNYQKHVKKSKKYDICYDCLTELKKPRYSAYCVDCGEQFTITNGEYEFFENKGYDPPKRCRECRKNKRERWDNSYNSSSTGDYYDDDSFSNDLSCFITTAVCNCLGKADDCYELEVLRSYRDDWLLRQDDGIELVSKYYLIAPQIVEWLKSRPDFRAQCQNLLNMYITPCINLIEDRKFEDCKILYMKMVNYLRQSMELNKEEKTWITV